MFGNLFKPKPKPVLATPPAPVATAPVTATPAAAAPLNLKNQYKK